MKYHYSQVYVCKNETTGGKANLFNQLIYFILKPLAENYSQIKYPD